MGPIAVDYSSSHVLPAMGPLGVAHDEPLQFSHPPRSYQNDCDFHSKTLEESHSAHTSPRAQSCSQYQHNMAFGSPRFDGHSSVCTESGREPRRYLGNRPGSHTEKKAARLSTPTPPVDGHTFSGDRILNPDHPSLLASFCSSPSIAGSFLSYSSPPTTAHTLVNSTSRPSSIGSPSPPPPSQLDPPTISTPPLTANEGGPAAFPLRRGGDEGEGSLAQGLLKVEYTNAALEASMPASAGQEFDVLSGALLNQSETKPVNLDAGIVGVSQVPRPHEETPSNIEDVKNNKSSVDVRSMASPTSLGCGSDMAEFCQVAQRSEVNSESNDGGDEGCSDGQVSHDENTKDHLKSPAPAAPHLLTVWSPLSQIRHTCREHSESFLDQFLPTVHRPTHRPKRPAAHSPEILRTTSESDGDCRRDCLSDPQCRRLSHTTPQLSQSRRRVDETHASAVVQSPCRNSQQTTPSTILPPCSAIAATPNHDCCPPTSSMCTQSSRNSSAGGGLRATASPRLIHGVGTDVLGVGTDNKVTEAGCLPPSNYTFNRSDRTQSESTRTQAAEYVGIDGASYRRGGWVRMKDVFDGKQEGGEEEENERCRRAGGEDVLRQRVGGTAATNQGSARGANCQTNENDSCGDGSAGHVPNPPPSSHRPNVPPCGLNRWVVLVVSLLISTSTGCFFFNWPSTQKMVLRSGAYEYLCYTTPQKSASPARGPPRQLLPTSPQPSLAPDRTTPANIRNSLTQHFNGSVVSSSDDTLVPKPPLSTSAKNQDNSAQNDSSISNDSTDDDLTAPDGFALEYEGEDLSKAIEGSVGTEMTSDKEQRQKSSAWLQGALRGIDPNDFTDEEDIQQDRSDPSELLTDTYSSTTIGHGGSNEAERQQRQRQQGSYIQPGNSQVAMSEISLRGLSAGTIPSVVHDSPSGSNGNGLRDNETAIVQEQSSSATTTQQLASRNTRSPHVPSSSQGLLFESDKASSGIVGVADDAEISLPCQSDERLQRNDIEGQGGNRAGTTALTAEESEDPRVLEGRDTHSPSGGLAKRVKRLLGAVLDFSRGQTTEVDFYDKLIAAAGNGTIDDESEVPLPDNGSKKNYACLKQIQAVNFLMPVGIASWLIFSFVGGLSVDLMGPKRTALLGLLLCATGWVLLAISGSGAPLFLPSMALIGCGIDPIFISVLNVSNLFPSRRGTVVSGFGAARSLSAGIPSVVNAMMSGAPDHFTFEASCFVFAGFLAFWMVLVTYVVPSEPYRLPATTEDEFEKENELEGSETIRAEDCEDMNRKAIDSLDGEGKTAGADGCRNTRNVEESYLVRGQTTEELSSKPKRQAADKEWSNKTDLGQNSGSVSVKDLKSQVLSTSQMITATNNDLNVPYDNCVTHRHSSSCSSSSGYDTGAIELVKRTGVEGPDFTEGNDESRGIDVSNQSSSGSLPPPKHYHHPRRSPSLYSDQTRSGPLSSEASNSEASSSGSPSGSSGGPEGFQRDVSSIKNSPLPRSWSVVTSVAPVSASSMKREGSSEALNAERGNVTPHSCCQAYCSKVGRLLRSLMPFEGSHPSSSRQSGRADCGATRVKLQRAFKVASTPAFFPLLPLAICTVVRGSFLANSASDQLPGGLPLFAILTPLSFITAPLFGFASDVFDIHAVLALLSILGIIQFSLLLGPMKLAVTVAVVILNFLISSFLLGQFYCYVTLLFPSDITGTLVGLTISTAGLFNLAVTPMYNYASGRHDFWSMNFICLMLACCSFGLVLFLWWHKLSADRCTSSTNTTITNATQSSSPSPIVTLELCNRGNNNSSNITSDGSQTAICESPTCNKDRDSKHRAWVHVSGGTASTKIGGVTELSSDSSDYGDSGGGAHWEDSNNEDHSSRHHPHHRQEDNLDSLRVSKSGGLLVKLHEDRLKILTSMLTPKMAAGAAECKFEQKASLQ